MRKIILPVIILSILIGTACSFNGPESIPTSTDKVGQDSKEKLWSLIEEKTWWHNNGWAGESYVFYKNDQGGKKCVHQILGSGLYVMSKGFVDCEIIDSDQIKIGGTLYTLKEDALISEKMTLTLYAKEPIIGDYSGPIDIKVVKSDDSLVETSGFNK